MGRLSTLTESNGPDRFNLSPNCSKHHAGIRTGISDYCCCCDPCNYVRKVDSAEQPENRFCCRCIPKLITAKFIADDSGTGSGTGTGSQSLCCRDAIIPMIAKVTTMNMQSVVTYTGSLVGHEITVILSNGHTGTSSNQHDYPCQWTISVPSLGVYEEIEIDHRVVTCLGVPAISIRNVTAFENCIGTISLGNYSTVKVPFQAREFSVDSPSLTVPFPEGYQCNSCSTLPRYLCITKKHNRTNRIRSPRISWEIDWWKEFTWEEGFIPYIDPLGTGTGTGTRPGTGTAPDEAQIILGRWRYNPNPSADPPVFTENVYLIQNLDGQCFLQPDFATPEGPENPEGSAEYYERVPLPNDCGCDFKILNVRPVNDPSPPAVPGESIPNDLAGIDIRGGRCSCWTYLCGRRRCVPQYLCGFAFINNVLTKDLLFVWNNSSKSWITTGGKDIEDNPVELSLEVRLKPGPDGSCQLETSYAGFEIDPVSIDDTTTVLNAVLEGTSQPTGTGTGTGTGDTAGYFNLTLGTSFDGDCRLLLTCSTATPCSSECKSHPQILHLRLHGYSTPTDVPPPPITGECTTEIDLIYWQTVVVSGSNILISCGYRGWKTVESYYYNNETNEPGVRTYLISATLSLGQLQITRTLIETPGIETPLVETVLFPSQSCDPYYAYKLTSASLRNCFFGSTDIIWHRWEAEVTE